VVLGGLVYLGYFLLKSKPTQTVATNNQMQMNQKQSNTQTSTGSAVSIANYAFNPQQLTVKAGAEVTWTNNDSVTHTVTFDSFNSGDIAPGGTYKHTFSDAGTFNYHCSIHTSMTGSIIVQ